MAHLQPEFPREVVVKNEATISPPGVGVAGLAGAAFATMLIGEVTRPWGPVVTWDSVAYLRFARDLTSVDQTMTLFGPLFPVLIAGIEKLDIPALQAVRLLNSLCFGMLILAGAWAGRRVASSRAGGVLPMLYLMFSYILIEQYSRVMSDPLGLTLGILGLVALLRFVEESRPLYLLGAALLIGGALAARFGSASFAIVGIAALLSRHTKPLRQRIRDTIFFGVVAGLPLGVWLVRNQLLTGGALHRPFSFHPPTFLVLSAGLDEISGWVLPRRVPFAIRIVAFVVLAVTWAVLHATRADRVGRSREAEFGWLLRLLCVAHVGFMLVVTTFVDASVTFGTRHLLPLYFAVLLLFALSLAEAVGPTSTPRRRRLVFGAAGSLLILWGGIAAAKGFRLHRDGDGYGSRAMQESVIRRLAEEPLRGRPVWTTDPFLVEWVSGVSASRLPSQFNPMTRQASGDYPSQLEGLRHRLEASEGVTVRLVAAGGGGRYPTVSELEETVGMKVLLEDSVARIFGRPKPGDIENRSDK